MGDPRNLALARKCLELIRDIADRGASSWDSEQVGYALQELSQILFERTGSCEREFEPLPAEQITDLRELYEELYFLDVTSQDMERPH